MNVSLYVMQNYSTHKHIETGTVFPFSWTNFSSSIIGFFLHHIMYVICIE